MELHVTPNVITTEHKLLENIQNLLIEQNKLLKSLSVNKIEDVAVPLVVEEKASVNLKKGGKR